MHNDLTIVKQSIDKRFFFYKRKIAVILTQESFPYRQLYCVQQFSKITTEGPPDYLFDANGGGGGGGSGYVQGEGEENIQVEIPVVCLHKRMWIIQNFYTLLKQGQLKSTTTVSSFPRIFLKAIIILSRMNANIIRIGVTRESISG